MLVSQEDPSEMPRPWIPPAVSGLNLPFNTPGKCVQVICIYCKGWNLGNVDGLLILLLFTLARHR